MMLTEETARALNVADRLDPRASIFGGARYFVWMRNQIPKRILEPDRTWFTLAAYNVGIGHLEDARILTQMHGKNPDAWSDVREHLPLLTQVEVVHAREAWLCARLGAGALRREHPRLHRHSGLGRGGLGAAGAARDHRGRRAEVTSRDAPRPDRAER